MELVALGIVGLSVAAVAARHFSLAVRHRPAVKAVRRCRDARAFIFGNRLQQSAVKSHRPPSPAIRRGLVSVSSSPEPRYGSGMGAACTTDPSVVLDAVAQGTWAGATVIRDLAEVDDSVYEAMSQLAGKQIDSIADLHAYLDAKWTSASLAQSLPEGAIRKLMGHLAEPMVKEHLEHAGVRVEMPVDSNQEGWDLILNGEHYVNVKTMADFSSLASHFDKYPDIPVVVPADIARLPADAIWIDNADAMNDLGDRVAAGYERIVLVDPDLSHADATDHAGAVGDAAMGHVDLAAGVPLFTAVMSSVRELKLLANDHTDMGHALKHVGLDVAGTGLGGLGGAKAGAAIGTLFVPGIGTGVGAVIGGLVGALFGRKVTNSVKEAPFDEALAAYRVTSEHAKRRAGQIEASAKAAYERKVREQKTRLADAAREAKQEIRERRTQAKRVVERGYSLSRSEAEALLDRARQELRAHGEELRRRLALVPWSRRLLWPDASTVVLRGSIHELRTLEKQLARAADSILFAATTRLDGDSSLRFFQTLLAVDTASDAIDAFVTRCEDERRHAEDNLRAAIGRHREQLMMLRNTAMHSIAGEVTRLRAECRESLTPLVEQVRVAGDSVRSQARRLGRIV